MAFRLALLTLRWRSPQKALDVGIDLVQVHGDTEAACRAFGYAIRSGHPDLAPAGLWWSAVCLRDRGDHARAVRFFRRAIESGHANFTPRAEIALAELLEGQGDVTGARTHYQRAIDFRRDGTDPGWAHRAAAKLEVMPTASAGSDRLADDRTQRVLLEKRIILVHSEIDNAEADRIVAQLLLLEQADPTADIHLWINSPGGYVTAGMAIFDTMRHIRPDVATCTPGLAAGIAQVLLSEGAPGKRYALPNAKINMLKPAAGSPHPTGIELDMLDRTTEEMTAILAAQTGQSVEQVAADSAAGRWFSATEALDYGLIDGIRDRLGTDAR